jgi:hypothetical protein
MLDVLKLRCDKLSSSEEEPEEPGKKETTHTHQQVIIILISKTLDLMAKPYNEI